VEVLIVLIIGIGLFVAFGWLIYIFVGWCIRQEEKEAEEEKFYKKMGKSTMTHDMMKEQ